MTRYENFQREQAEVEQKTLEIRLATLKEISGLDVTGYRMRGRLSVVWVFQFLDEGNTIKTVCTYPKAKMFAEGVRYGFKMVEKLESYEKNFRI